MDPMERRVWERVMARSSENTEIRNIKALLSEAAELAGAYRQLAGSLSGRGKALARKLYEGELANLACLRGMAVLSGSPVGSAAVPAAGRKPAVRLAEMCYHRSRKALLAYMAHGAEPEFGVVFQQMAKRQEIQCAMIAELLGQPVG